jgi:hypothetical protein
LRDGADGGNGQYRYTATSTAVPDSTYLSQNYWVDVVFVSAIAGDTAPPAVTATTPAPNRSGVSVSTTIAADGLSRGRGSGL